MSERRVRREAGLPEVDEPVAAIQAPQPPAHDPRTVANVLALQRAGGNQAVARLLQRQRAAGGGPVLQRRWKDIGAIDPESRNGPDFERALLVAARQTGAPLTKQYEGLTEFFKLGGLTILTPVREFLKAALEDGQDHETNELLSQVISMVTAVMRPPMQQLEEGADDENDHPEEDGASPEEELITDPTHVNTAELQDEPELLRIIFANITNALGYGELSENAFREWYQSGVVTRQGFKEILERNQVKATQGQGALHLKRRPNTASGPSSYVSSNFGQFNNVTYTTDGKANINFLFPTAQTLWQNPVLPNSVVKLQKGATRKGYGILNNGVETKLFRAGRARHNMIANRLRPDLAGPASVSYTWHHRSKEYEMELVDYMTHRKHGHNGGFLFWQDGM